MAELEALADRVLARPGERRDVLADDRNLRCAAPVRLRECAAADEGDLEGREVVRMHRLQVEGRVGRRAVRALPLGGELGRIPAAGSREGRRIDRRRPAEAGHGLQLGHDVLQELAVAGVVGVLRLGQLEPYKHQAVRGQPHLHGLEPQEAVRQQARRRHDRDREGDLRHDEGAAAPSRHAPRHAASSAAQVSGQIGACQG